MSESPSSPGLVEALVRSCRSRVASQISRRECFLASGVALVGICSLLLMGTRYVPVVMLPLAASLGAWMAIQRWRADLPSGYAVARRIDRREALADQISTAYYFRLAETGTFSRAVADLQYERATRTAATVRPATVFPRTVPSTQRTATALLAAALLMFGLRAALQSSLSFEPPLATLLMTSLFGAGPEPPPAGSTQAAALEQGEADPGMPEPEDLFERPAGEPEENDNQLPHEAHEEQQPQSDEMPEVEGLITLPLEEIQAENAADGAMMQGEDGPAGEENAADLPPDPSDDGWDDESQSLMDKLKQAFANMLETLDMASVESSDSEQGKEQGSGNAEESASAGDPAQSGEADQAMTSQSADASMEGGEPGQEVGETASAGNTSGEDSTGEQSSGENASAAGTSDGSKDFAEAEHEEVLGALEQLYMERAENMKGEVTIETRLAEQSASVPYRQRSTTHSDRGGAVTRDEIPASYRTYIQNYFDTLRRNTE